MFLVAVDSFRVSGLEGTVRPCCTSTCLKFAPRALLRGLALPPDRHSSLGCRGCDLDSFLPYLFYLSPPGVSLYIAGDHVLLGFFFILKQGKQLPDLGNPRSNIFISYDRIRLKEF